MPRTLLSFTLGLTLGLVGSSFAATSSGDASSLLNDLNQQTHTLGAQIQSLTQGYAQQQLMQTQRAIERDTRSLDSLLRSSPQADYGRRGTRSPGPSDYGHTDRRAPGPPDHARDTPRASPDSEVDDIVASLQRQSFSNDQMSLLQTASSTRAYTVSQVLRLLAVFSFDSDRVKAAVMLYPHVTDPGNWYRIADAFSFSSSMNDVNRQLGL